MRLDWKPGGGGVAVADNNRQRFTLAVYWSPEIGFGWVDYRRHVVWNIQMWPLFDAGRLKYFAGPRRPVILDAFIKKWNLWGRYK